MSDVVTTATADIPARLQVGGEWLRVLRSWPGSDGARILECRDEAGRLRAARLMPGAASEPDGIGDRGAASGSCDGLGQVADARLEVLPFSRDPKLRSLAPGGELLVHRAGKRAVVRTADGFVKHLRRGRAEGGARATETLGGLAVRAGFTAPRVVAADQHSVTLTTVPGMPLLSLDPAEWERAWAQWEDLWPRLVLAPVPATAEPIGLHDAHDEAEVVRTWCAHVRAFDAGGLGTRWASQLAVIEEHTVGLLREVAAQTSAGAARTASAGRPPVIAHRDLHDGQMLFDPVAGQLGILDFDTAVRADRELDLGNLDVHLDLRVAQGLLDPDRARVAHAAIRRTADAVDADARRLEVYRRAARARLVGVYAFRPQWARLAARMAEELADVR